MELHERSHFNASILFLTDALQAPALKESVVDLYWHTLHAKCTYAQWQAACRRIVTEHTEHRIPTLATILEYLKTVKSEDRSYRQAQTTHLLEAPAPLSQEETRAFLDGVFSQLATRRMPGTIIIDDDPLAYIPQVDAEAEKHKLRQQLQALLVESAKVLTNDQS